MEFLAAVNREDSLHEGLGSHRHRGQVLAQHEGDQLRGGELGCGQDCVLGNVELTDGALWFEVSLARCDLAGVLLDRGAPRGIFLEGSTSLRRDLRAGLGVDKRSLMVERDLREGLAGGLALRDALVETPTPRGER